MRFHPAAQILTWCILVAVLHLLALWVLIITSSVLLFFAIIISGRKFILLLRRTRWLMFTLLLVYAWSTPGVALFDWPGTLSPTMEGLEEGVMQLMRLAAALAGLAILLDRLHRLQLISGLYTLFMPMRWFGVSRERFAVRLALTLHYAEVGLLRGTTSWQEYLRSLFEPHEESVKTLELQLHRIGIGDVALLLAATAILWLVWP